MQTEWENYSQINRGTGPVTESVDVSCCYNHSYWPHTQALSPLGAQHLLRESDKETIPRHDRRYDGDGPGCQESPGEWSNCVVCQGLKEEAKKFPTKGAQSRNWERVQHDQRKEFSVKTRFPNWPLLAHLTNSTCWVVFPYYFKIRGYKADTRELFPCSGSQSSKGGQRVK